MTTKQRAYLKGLAMTFRSNLPDWKEQHDTGSYQSYPGGTGRKRTDQSQCTYRTAQMIRVHLQK